MPGASALSQTVAAPDAFNASAAAEPTEEQVLVHKAQKGDMGAYDELVRRYQTELAGYFGEIETLCAGRGIDYLRTTTALPFEDFVLQTLRQVSSVA